MLFSRKRFNSDDQIGCIIRAIPGLLQEEDFTLEEADKSCGKLLLGDFEELVSRLITIKYMKEEDKPPKVTYFIVYQS